MTDDMAFERKLYVIRKRVEHARDRLAGDGHRFFYVPSLSSRTIIYKGMLIADQVAVRTVSRLSGSGNRARNETSR